MRFLIVRTDIRAAADGDIAAAWACGGRLRDETTTPEPRRQIVHAEDRDAALLLARALATVGAVRSGQATGQGPPARRARPPSDADRPHRHLITPRRPSWSDRLPRRVPRTQPTTTARVPGP